MVKKPRKPKRRSSNSSSYLQYVFGGISLFTVLVLAVLFGKPVWTAISIKLAALGAGPRAAAMRREFEAAEGVSPAPDGCHWFEEQRLKMAILDGQSQEDRITTEELMQLTRNGLHASWVCSGRRRGLEMTVLKLSAAFPQIGFDAKGHMTTSRITALFDDFGVIEGKATVESDTTLPGTPRSRELRISAAGKSHLLRVYELDSSTLLSIEFKGNTQDPVVDQILRSIQVDTASGSLRGHYLFIQGRGDEFTEFRMWDGRDIRIRTSNKSQPTVPPTDYFVKDVDELRQSFPQFYDQLTSGSGTFAQLRPAPETPPLVVVEREPVDVLKLIDTQRHYLLGRWLRKGDELLSPRGQVSMLEMPFSVSAPYEMIIEAERVGPDIECFGVTFPVGDSWVMLVLDGYSGKASGLNRVGGLNALNNSTSYKHPVLPPGKHTIRIAVQPNTITVEVDQNQIIHWTGDPKDLTLESDWMKGTGRPFLGTWNAEYLVSRIEVRKL